MLADYLAREGSATPLMGLSVRERTVLQLGRLCHFDEAHARTVVRLATALFDSACATGLASPDPDAREILAYAAWLHDIGAFLSYVNHAVHGYYMIRHAELLGFDQAQQEMIAATVLRHRKGSARQADVKHTALEPEARALVERLALFLRLAESLDRSHAGLVRDARLAPEGDARAVLTMDTVGECQLECRGVQGHVKAFARTFGRELSVCVRGG
jgi:exopolyphosphatase/guanosine-5'-triphosphate,3'-diphosphate pyrophosphatase